jgi:hypothetical protein
VIWHEMFVHWAINGKAVNDLVLVSSNARPSQSSLNSRANA